ERTTAPLVRQAEKPLVGKPSPRREPVPPMEAPPAFPRRSRLSESDLSRFAKLHSKELDLETEKGTSKRIWDEPLRRSMNSEPIKTQGKLFPPITAFVADREDLRGLPFRSEGDCQAPKETAAAMARLSPLVRE